MPQITVQNGTQPEQYTIDEIENGDALIMSGPPGDGILDKNCIFIPKQIRHWVAETLAPGPALESNTKFAARCVRAYATRLEPGMSAAAALAEIASILDGEASSGDVVWVPMSDNAISAVRMGGNVISIMGKVR